VPDRVVAWWATMRTSSSQARARPRPSCGCWLLVVAVSVVNADDSDPRTRELRTVLAGGAFVVLVDIFFVSIVTLTGDSVAFAPSSVAMASVGLLATRRLIPRAKRLVISPPVLEPEG
jgi:hypothetical protein